MKCTEETKNNCQNFPHACWHCEGGNQYHAINPNIQSCWHKQKAEQRKAERKAKKHTTTSKKARRSKAKGSEGEREVVALLERYGFKAERQLLSGAAGNFNKKWAGDVIVTSPISFAIEVKRRKNSLKTIENRFYDESSNGGIVKAGDILIMPVIEFIALMQGEKLNYVEEQLRGIDTFRNWLNQSTETPVVFFRSDGNKDK